MSHDIKRNADGSYAAVFTASTWHRLEKLQAMNTAADLINAGEKICAFPTNVVLESMTTTTGLAVPGNAVVADYIDGSRVAHSAVGNRYTPLDPSEWRATIEAAVKAGATPAGAFALNGGSKVLATFEIPGGNGGTGIKNYLNLVDSLDGSTKFLAGGTSIRTVCANTLSASMRKDGKGYAGLRHTASINDKAEILRTAIETHVKEGETLTSLYREATKAHADRGDLEKMFDLFFPKGKDGDSQRLKTRLENKRAEGSRAMLRPENNEGATLATVWNAATWLVDRTDSGSARSARGGADSIESMLFGSRGKRIEEIRSIVEVVLATGEVVEMEASEAASHGVDAGQIGRSMLADMLS